MTYLKSKALPPLSDNIRYSAFCRKYYSLKPNLFQFNVIFCVKFLRLLKALEQHFILGPKVRYASESLLK